MVENIEKRRKRQRRYKHTEKGRVAHKRYLKSWVLKNGIKRRREAKQFFGDKCSVCGRKLVWGTSKGGMVNLHHMNRGKHKQGVVYHPEMWDKCVLLCSGCHMIIHGLAKRTEQQVEDILHFVCILQEA